MHHLARKADQIDFQIRMTQFLDPSLKAASEPDRTNRGVPDVDKQDATRALDESVGDGLTLE